METPDNVTGKYEDCRDATKQATIYVWNRKFQRREKKKKSESSLNQRSHSSKIFTFLFLVYLSTREPEPLCVLRRRPLIYLRGGRLRRQ